MKGYSWFDWTPERVEQFKSLYARDWTHTQIGIELGISRNASIGKAHRLDLPTRVEQKPKQRAGKDTGGGAVTKIKIRLQRKRAHKEVPDIPPDQSTCAVRFLDHKAGLCVWPLWAANTPAAERMVCGAPSTISHDQRGNVRLCSYCQRHRAIAYSNKREPFVRRSRYGVRTA